MGIGRYGYCGSNNIGGISLSRLEKQETPELTCHIRNFRLQCLSNKDDAKKTLETISKFDLKLAARLKVKYL